MERGALPVFKRRKFKGEGTWTETPECEHGAWTFAGADFKNRRSKWRCPTGACKPKSQWVKADRRKPSREHEPSRSPRSRAITDVVKAWLWRGLLEGLTATAIYLGLSIVFGGFSIFVTAFYGVSVTCFFAFSDKRSRRSANRSANPS